MSVKNILCAYNGAPSSDVALRAAVLMHKKYNAHVTGLFAYGGSRIDSNLRSWMPKTLQSSLLKVENDLCENVESQFRKITEAKVQGDYLHWISEKGRSNATVADYARMFDITVVGQFDSVLGAEHVELRPDHIALRSGRPVLMIPKNWSEDAISDHAVLAWDGRRTATRALADAMQILETKRLITVLTIDNGKKIAPLNGICVEDALTRHGVEVERVHVKPKGRTVGQAILDYCKETEATFLVAGAYEHSIFREELVGGVTNTIVSQADIPVLISH